MRRGLCGLWLVIDMLLTQRMLVQARLLHELLWPALKLQIDGVLEMEQGEQASARGEKQWMAEW